MGPICASVHVLRRCTESIHFEVRVHGIHVLSQLSSIVSGLDSYRMARDVNIKLPHNIMQFWYLNEQFDIKQFALLWYEILIIPLHSHLNSKDSTDPFSVCQTSTNTHGRIGLCHLHWNLSQA